MLRRLRRKMHTWLIYKISCVLKWTVVKIISIIKAHYYDKKLGIETSDFVSFKNVRDSFKDGIYKDGEVYEATSYDKLKALFSYLQLTDNDVFVDLGCGKGRVVLFASQLKLKKTVGIELKKELFEIARDNLSKLKTTTPVEFLNADVVNVNMCEGTVFFMYNSFGPLTMSKVLSNIKESLSTNPRIVRIVYFNSVFSYLLNGQDWLVREEEIGSSRDTVWRNKY